MSFNVIEWEYLFWFLKFLIPDLKVRDQEKDELDGLLNSIDLSTYGVERQKLNEKIELDEADAQVDPTANNMRGIHDDDDDKNPLDEIIREFNERWFANFAAGEDGEVGYRNNAHLGQ